MAWRRMMVAMKIIVACGVAGIMHYRVFLPHLAPMATGQFDGPFTQAVSTLKSLVPMLLLVIVFGTLVWVAVGGLQEERARDTNIQRRR